jgi:hypothetical protein
MFEAPCNVINSSHFNDATEQVHTQNFALGVVVGAHHKAIYNLCLILKIKM